MTAIAVLIVGLAAATPIFGGAPAATKAWFINLKVSQEHTVAFGWKLNTIVLPPAGMINM